MSGFLDHLFDSTKSGKQGRERIRYREKLRVLIQDAPAVRRLPSPELPNLTLASLTSGNILPSSDILVEQIGQSASADSFRIWKQKDSHRPIWRLDCIESEEQILETRAMGADAYALKVSQHDLPMLQFLVEFGHDYGLPCLLCTETAEELALALQIQDGGILWLRGEIGSTQLLDWEGLRNRTVFIESTDELVVSADWTCFVIQINAHIPTIISE